MGGLCYKESNLEKKRVVAIILATPVLRESRRHLAAGKVGDRTAEGTGLALGPARGVAGAVDTTSQQAMVVCTPFEGNISVR